MGKELILEFSVSNYPPDHSLSELELWPPNQAASQEFLPLDIELRFDSQVFETPKLITTVRLTRAEIQIDLQGLEVVRGSRFGDEINDPYDTQELSTSIRTQFELEEGVEGSASVSISRNPLGKLVASVRRRIRKSSVKENDRSARVSLHSFRVVAKGKNRWLVCEPREPGILNGRFLGQSNDGSKSKPLCALSFLGEPAIVKVFLRCWPYFLVTETVRKSDAKKLTGNKALVLQMLQRKSISVGGLKLKGNQMQSEGLTGSILLNMSEMEVKIGGN